MQLSQSRKLANVCYDIRGPVLEHAKRLEAEGHLILKLNIGNPAPFGFDAPEEILQDVILEPARSAGIQRLQGPAVGAPSRRQYTKARASRASTSRTSTWATASPNSS